MEYLLLVLAIVIPCWYAYRQSVSGGRVEINHVTTLTFGFLFYWVTPLAVRILSVHIDFALARLWSVYFRESLIVPYALCCLGLFLCFMLGDGLGVRWFPARPLTSGETVPRLMLSLVTLCGCLLLLYSGYLERTNLFRHPEPGMNAIGAARGAVTACLVLLGCAALMFSVGQRRTPWHKLLANGYFLPPLVVGAVMLWLGSRLYVASLLLMFLIYQTNLRQRLSLRWVVAAGLLFALVFGAIGSWREGSSPTSALSNVLVEPMNGSLSLVHYLRYRGISWFNAPTALMGDFQNLVPTVLMPDKYKRLKKPDAYIPVGGLHSFVSFNMNFGLAGTAVFWLLWPMLFRYLKSRMSDVLPATVYIMGSGWLAFTFFRDMFSISLVKAIFEDSVVIPCLIVVLGRLLTAACSPEAESASLPPAEGVGAG